MRADRNTPAYAGKTEDDFVYVPEYGKHPRLRGEDAERESAATASRETPPLTRGRPHNPRPRASCPGNTPAYAGKTPCQSRTTSSRRKHPRLRGEDSCRHCREARVKETPPLTRGRLRSGVTTTPSAWKHPRLRGEDPGTGITLILSIETPPLTRGRRFVTGVRSTPIRNTPAYAGKTRR